MSTERDPWIHRSKGMKCQTCMWFVEKGALGRCRRHAPTMNGYPVVYSHDWCGDHKLDEEKVTQEEAPIVIPAQPHKKIYLDGKLYGYRQEVI